MKAWNETGYREVSSIYCHRVESIMGNPKYTRLDEEDEDTDSQPNVSISNKKTATALKWSIVANCVLALAAFGSTTFLLRDYGLRKHQDVSACDIQWYNIVQDVSRAPETEIKPYYYLEDGFDDDDFGLGDPYWRSLFPSKPATTKICFKASGGPYADIVEQRVMGSSTSPMRSRMPCGCQQR